MGNDTNANMIPGLGKEGEAAAVFVGLGKLRGWEHNPKKATAEDIQDIAASMRRFGWGSPILARSPEDPEVIAGHTRMLAAAHIGIPVAPVRYMTHLSAAEAHALAIADNQLAANPRWDQSMLEAVMRNELATDPTIDLHLLGFTETALSKMLAETPAAQVIEISLADLRDEFWISVRGPMPAQADALDILRRALEGLDGLQVELGTVTR